ncbi:lytic murein transglycosylase B [Paraferrimonas sp. SM1919]|uniref:lytic murein transglycosylase B n=1 Tax=Paraferrimonas sp. SM1919 TaxID=2662263 RepID=UPI0013D3D9A9|nr:lytic murein transglycosylase B [Paraferrimonas sp. SM1919]
MKKITIALFTLLASSLHAADNKRIEEFKQTVKKQGLSSHYIEQQIEKAVFQPEIIEAITKPWEAKPWHQYYPLFLTQERLQAGLSFWKNNLDTVTKASQRFGVDSEVIIAIIGIETFYGRIFGKHKVRDALFTLGFHYPPRQDFFMSEFGHLLHLAKEEQLNLDELYGSYAGAMGFGQFIPSSYRAYSIDFNEDGQRNLFEADDAIASVANYLHKHKWQLGQDIVAKTQLDKADKALLWNNRSPQTSISQWQQLGVDKESVAHLAADQKAILIKLQQVNHDEYWLGLNNFYAITRYNRSPLYAMVVTQFAKQLKNAKDF